jgi:hypothetical protein
LEYEESYHFDAHHFIDRAESFLSFRVGALYECSIAHTIELIQTDEPKTIRAE